MMVELYMIRTSELEEFLGLETFESFERLTGDYYRLKIPPTAQRFHSQFSHLCVPGGWA